MSEREEAKFFSVPEIGDMLGISRTKAYELICSDACPFNAVRIRKRICVPANSFYKWYESWAGDESPEFESAEE